MSFFSIGRKKETETDFVKVIPATAANCCDSDGSGSLHATGQSKNSYPKILKVQEWEVNV
jgi:hypothetical protein